MGRGNGGLSSLFPLPIVTRVLSFSFSPASPQHKEASAEEKVSCQLDFKRSIYQLSVNPIQTSVFGFFW